MGGVGGAPPDLVRLLRGGAHVEVVAPHAAVRATGRQAVRDAALVVVDATLRAWSSRRMDNDQPNTQPTIPANATADLKISGEIDRFFWSVSVNNLFNAEYYDYAIASASWAGVFNAYPLPGRTYMVRAGVTF